MGTAATETSEETFLQTLYRGSELIGQGELEDARNTLVEAVAMRPDDPKARNLLGLAHFKLGDYEAAEGLYRDLVDENGDDATLRVNLGLVYLKTGRFEEAIRELAAAVDLQPDHLRAQNYLGLAYARVGDYAQARECFIAAGSGQMVERMDRLLAGEEPEDPAVAAVAPGPKTAGTDRFDDGAAAKGAAGPRPAEGDAVPVPLTRKKTESAEDDDEEVEIDVADGDGDEGEEDELLYAVDDASDDEDEGVDSADAAGHDDEATGADVAANAAGADTAGTDAAGADTAGTDDVGDGVDAAAGAPGAASEVGATDAAPVDVDVDIQDESGAFDPAITPRTEAPAPARPATYSDGAEETARPRPDFGLPVRILEFAERVSLPGAIPAAFAVSGRVVVASIEGEILSRAHRLVAADGSLAFRPEVKRFRGRATDKPFGEGTLRMMRVTGSGRLYFATAGRRFTPVKVDGADAYLREEGVFAFEETVSYENGRVPSKVSGDLNLVHLRGKGAVLVESDGPVASLVITPDGPLRIPLDRLVGWTGLVTPRIVAFADEGGPEDGPLAGVELAGQGTALLALLPDAG